MKNDDLNYVSLLAKDSIVNEKYLSVPSNLKISGTVRKNIDCKGKLVIASPGVVEGNLKAKNLVLEGTFKGNAWVREVLCITGSATFTGYISADKIEIKEGAVCHFKAEIDRGANKRFDDFDIISGGKRLTDDSSRKMHQRSKKTSKKKREAVKPEVPSKKTNSKDQNKKKDEPDHFW